MTQEAIYKVTNKKDSARLEIFGPIGGYDGFKLSDFNAAVSGLDVAALDIDLNSPGGDAFEAFAIHDAIKALSARVTVNIIGVAASAATIIAAAADRVTITENSRYLVHEASTYAEGKKDSIAESAEMLRKIDEQMIGVYVKRTGKTRSELEQLMKKDSFISANEALQWGFVDEIINNQKTKIMTKKEVQAKAEETEEPKEDDMTAKMKAMEEEIENLKAKLAKAEEENEEWKKKAKAAEEEQVDAMIEAAIQAGKIKASAKAQWVTLAMTDKEAARTAIDAIQVAAPKLADVPKQADAKADPKAEFLAKVKSGYFKDKPDEAAKEYQHIFKTIK